MRKTLLLLVSMILLSVLLIGCSKPDSTAEKPDEAETVAKTDKTTEKSTSTLPDGFPKDFPIPDDFTIKNVEDKSEGKRNHYVISVDFDPALDLEPVFDLYKAYADKIDYTIVLGGEEYFAEEMFQFGATNTKSAGDMYIVTLKVVGGVYGSIDVRFTEE